jgi:hypothetical protein
MRLMLLWMMGCGMMGGDEAVVPTPSPEPLVATPAPQDEPPTEAPKHEGGVAASDCDTIEPGEAPAGPGCITGTIACGETVVGHTLGGSNNFNTAFYDAKFCTPGTTNHDSGEERVYTLQVPDGDHLVKVHLDTPCADLDLAAMRWEGDDCPTIDNAIQVCDMWPKPNTEPELVKIVSRGAAQWLVVVEGKNDADGPFSLTVECKEGLYD